MQPPQPAPDQHCPACDSDHLIGYRREYGPPGTYEHWWEEGIACAKCGNTRVPYVASTSKTIPDPRPMEESDPELAAHIMEIVHGRHPAVLSLNAQRNPRTGHFYYKLRPRTAQPTVGRNEPCPCGSGLKSKKCCGR